MSLISDALKETRRQTTNDNNENEGLNRRFQARSPAVEDNGRRQRFAVFALVGLLLAIGVVTTLSLLPEKGPAEPVAENEVVVQSEPAAGDAGAGAVDSSSSGPGAAAVAATSDGAPKTGDAAPPTVQDVAPSAPVAAIRMASPEIVEKYQVKGIMQTKAGYMALINSQIVYVGDALPGGAVITEIDKKYVNIKMDGELYQLPFVVK